MIAGAKIARLGYSYEALEKGYWRCVKALAEAGNRVIADNSLVSSDQKQFALSETSGFQCLWVGVHCGLAELQRRENQRGDRALGTAERELKTIHDSMKYDMEVDTERNEVDHLAELIASFIGP